MVTKAGIHRSLRDLIVRYCTEKKPQEACGLLLGSVTAETVHVTDFLPVPNRSDKPAERFDMDPAVLVPIATKASSAAYSIVGVLHSHPSAPPVPSSEDLATAWRIIPSHWIVSLQGEVRIKVYRFNQTSPSAKAALSPTGYTSIRLIVHE